MAAAVVNEGPEKHKERDYWRSVDVLDGSEVASILSETTGQSITFSAKTHEDFKTLGGTEFMRQVANGQMGYIGTIRDDVPYVLGRPALKFRECATENKEKFVEIVSKQGVDVELSLSAIPTGQNN
ncbi:hypothetical protein QFC21_005488 [Naganishia friedmannii]|uniref:Uncharacterized protein n=1 Tax=Naganishia friedmannii TaxID=89922 RepID=A0ACC2V8K6_9TREE|nr:hypothetical protein QFC21_005488 [Naganishia friedmannii]